MSTNNLNENTAAEVDPFLIDHNYRNEALKAIQSYLSKCHEEMKKMGVKPPAWPEVDDKTVSGLVARMLLTTTWRLSFNDNTLRCCLSEIPRNSYVLTKEQLIKNVNDILPHHRLIKESIYNKFSYLIIDKGTHVEGNFIESVNCYLATISGICGSLINLLETTEQNNAAFLLAKEFQCEINMLATMLGEADCEKPFDEDFLGKIKNALTAVSAINEGVMGITSSSSNDEFGQSLTVAIDEYLYLIQSFWDQYSDYRQTMADKEKVVS